MTKSEAKKDDYVTIMDIIKKEKPKGFNPLWDIMAVCAGVGNNSEDDRFVEDFVKWFNEEQDKKIKNFMNKAEIQKQMSGLWEVIAEEFEMGMALAVSLDEKTFIVAISINEGSRQFFIIRNTDDSLGDASDIIHIAVPDENEDLIKDELTEKNLRKWILWLKADPSIS